MFLNKDSDPAVDAAEPSLGFSFLEQLMKPGAAAPLPSCQCDSLEEAKEELGLTKYRTEEDQIAAFKETLRHLDNTGQLATFEHELTYGTFSWFGDSHPALMSQAALLHHELDERH